MSDNVNLAVEQKLLGGLLDKDNQKALPKILQKFQPEDFYNQHHRIIFIGMRDLYQSGKPVDLESIAKDLEDKEVLKDAGGISYLLELKNKEVMTANEIYYYAKCVKDNADGKKLEKDLDRAKKKNRGNTPILEVIDDLEKEMDEIRIERGKEIIPELDIESYEEWLNNLGSGKLTGFNTGFDTLNNSTLGLSGLWVIGAGPKMHKSTLVLQIATNIAMQEVSVIYYDLENGEKRIMMRLHSRFSKLGFEAIRRAQRREGTEEEIEAYDRGLEQIKTLKPYFTLITDRTKIDLPTIEAQIRAIQRTHNTDKILLAFDPLQKLHSKQKERRLQIDEWLRNFERLKTQFNCNILVVSELRRTNNDYSNVTMQDFKESGDIEYTAETLIGINKPKEDKDEYTLDILASRDGMSGLVGHVKYIPKKPLWYLEEVKKFSY